jgi:hypothetical protein
VRIDLPDLKRLDDVAEGIETLIRLLTLAAHANLVAAGVHPDVATERVGEVLRRSTASEPS